MLFERLTKPVGIILNGVHIGLEYNRCRDAVHQCLVAASHLADAALEHRAVSHHRGEALVVEHNLLIGIGVAQTPCQRLDVTHRLGGFAIHLRGLAQDDYIDLIL